MKNEKIYVVTYDDFNYSHYVVGASISFEDAKKIAFKSIMNGYCETNIEVYKSGLYTNMHDKVEEGYGLFKVSMVHLYEDGSVDYGWSEKQVHCYEEGDEENNLIKYTEENGYFIVVHKPFISREEIYSMAKEKFNEKHSY